MNLSETAQALALAAAFDQRTVGETDVYAWQSVLDDVDRECAFAAIKAHYREHRERIMPADIRRYKRETPLPPPVDGEECEHGYPAPRLCPFCRRAEMRQVATT